MVRECRRTAGSCFATPLCIGIPGAVRNSHSLFCETFGRLLCASCPAFDSCEHGTEGRGVCVLACCLHIANEIGIRLSWPLFPSSRSCFLRELTRRTFL